MQKTSRRRMQINGHYIYVEITGASRQPAVVMLHHGLGSTAAWKAQVPALAGSGYQAIVYDRWGYGKSDPRQSLGVPDFKDDQQDLIALLDELGISRACLVGHSDGGTIALYLAVRYPERVLSVVTVAAHIYIEPRMESGILGIQKAFENDPRFRAGLKRLHGEKTEAVFANWSNGWVKLENRGWNIRSQLQNITCPVWVVQGIEDEDATPQHARDIADSIHNAQLWLAHGARHMLPQEIPGEFNRRLVVFIAKTMNDQSFKVEQNG
jgi:pimeloyl-ACP methyl ester carboxylesterase